MLTQAYFLSLTHTSSLSVSLYPVSLLTHLSPSFCFSFLLFLSLFSLSLPHTRTVSHILTSTPTLSSSLPSTHNISPSLLSPPTPLLPLSLSLRDACNSHQVSRIMDLVRRGCDPNEESPRVRENEYYCTFHSFIHSFIYFHIFSFENI